MANVIEVNGPAFLLVAIEDARKMLEEGLVQEALALLGEARDCAQDVVNWIQDMQVASIMLPDGLGWTDRLRKRREARTGGEL
jgi:hypothetical protein